MPRRDGARPYASEPPRRAERAPGQAPGARPGARGVRPPAAGAPQGDAERLRARGPYGPAGRLATPRPGDEGRPRGVARPRDEERTGGEQRAAAPGRARPRPPYADGERGERVGARQRREAAGANAAGPGPSDAGRRDAGRTEAERAPGNRREAERERPARPKAPAAGRRTPERPGSGRPRPPRPRGGSGGAGGSGRPPSRLRNPRPRLRLVSLALTLVMLAFVVRLLQVQAVDANAYTAKANVNRYIPVTLAAERGSITDRTGVELATTVDAYDITAAPDLLTPERAKVNDAPQQAAALLSPILGVGERELVGRLTANPKSKYAVLARQRTPQVWNQIKDLKSALSDKEAKGRGVNVLAGINRERHSKRVYPNGDLAAGVLGFVNAQGKGSAGIEQMLNTELAGKDGKRVYAQSGGRQVPTADVKEQPAVPGSDVELTIDRDLQWAAQKAISDQVRESKADGGYVVVQDTRTGEILALANAPGFDPANVSAADPAALGNAALTDAYEPGSTSKLMSLAAVLEEGAATPHTRVVVPNRLPRADRAFADDIDHPTWHLTLNGVLAKSSNIGTILATEQLGEKQPEANEVLYSYLRRFGLGQPTGLDFPGETAGILAKPKDWSASQQYTIPFGQGLSLNAVQAASVYSTIAGGGERVVPTLVRGTKGPDGRFTPAPEPQRTRVVSEKTARTLARMLESVVDDEEGTGAKAKIPGYRVAGKTGTSNRVDPKTGRYHGYTASFAGFAPADKPRVTVYCAVQNPTKGSYFGGQVCGPIYKQVMEFALKTMRVAPTGKQPARLPVTYQPGQ
ncbi:penicillin-binding transpeptidase domain-containing protein [Streptomyces buecherae]|uniref:penicillin-binding transpeptidase domain-containing protein n=1 Tax=Streptomyces buecherae TaxID=2763006 RepID=UPI0022B77E01|nr:penicillin-binding transpeptidase domain-containing protein [Streptomyces buecherae]